MIPFNRAATAEHQFDYLHQAMENGFISGNGPFCKRAESLLSDITGSPSVLTSTSCTHALELAARLADLGPGDEVIVPAYTFVSTASAFALTGASIRYADVRDDTLNIDLDSAKSLVSENTKVICGVHYAGIGADPDEFASFCSSRGLLYVEDNAHGLGGSYKGAPLGSFGSLSAMSFHETKNVTCGEGGALGINDLSFIDRAEILREKGTNRSRFLRGQVDKYTWVDVGSSWVLSDLLAAVLVAQLEDFAATQEKRVSIWNAYENGLRSWAKASDVRLPYVPSHSEHPAHMFFVRLPDLAERDRFIEHLRKRDVSAVFHYQPLNLSEVASRSGSEISDCPVSERASETLVRLPLFPDLRPFEVDQVIESVLTFKL